MPTPDPQQPTRTFHVKCHCTSSSFTFTLPQSPSQIPIPAHFCHCSICRYTHGTLTSIHARIPAPPDDEIVGLEKVCTKYESSRGVEKWFCSTCGAHLLDCVDVSGGADGEKEEREDEDGEKNKKKGDGEKKREDGDGDGDGDGNEQQRDQKEWYVAVSLVEDAEEEDWKFESHIFVEGTGDGGLAVLLEEIGGKKIGLWKERERERMGDVERGDWDAECETSTGAASASATPSNKNVNIKDDDPDSKTETQHPEKLQVKCHCGGIEFYISRPTSPASFTDLDSTLVPNDKSKWLATHDVCTTCRLTSSTAIVSWLFTTVSSLSLPDGSAYPPDGLIGTAKRYMSSADVARTFCGTCGASVTYACRDRPGMVDVALGLVRAEGVRAEEWVEWRTEKVSFEEDGMWKGVVLALKEGLKRYV